MRDRRGQKEIVKIEKTEKEAEIQRYSHGNFVENNY